MIIMLAWPTLIIVPYLGIPLALYSHVYFRMAMNSLTGITYCFKLIQSYYWRSSEIPSFSHQARSRWQWRHYLVYLPIYTQRDVGRRPIWLISLVLKTSHGSLLLLGSVVHCFSVLFGCVTGRKFSGKHYIVVWSMSKKN